MKVKYGDIVFTWFVVAFLVISMCVITNLQLDEDHTEQMNSLNQMVVLYEQSVETQEQQGKLIIELAERLEVVE